MTDTATPNEMQQTYLQVRADFLEAIGKFSAKEIQLDVARGPMNIFSLVWGIQDRLVELGLRKKISDGRLMARELMDLKKDARLKRTAVLKILMPDAADVLSDIIDESTFNPFRPKLDTKPLGKLKL